MLPDPEYFREGVPLEETMALIQERCAYFESLRRLHDEEARHFYIKEVAKFLNVPVQEVAEVFTTEELESFVLGENFS